MQVTDVPWSVAQRWGEQNFPVPRAQGGAGQTGDSPRAHGRAQTNTSCIFSHSSAPPLGADGGDAG